MNAVAFLLGLLVLAYLGSILVGGRAIRGFGLASGAEYLVLGFVLGPQVLSVVGRSLVDSFQPVVLVGVSWVGLVLGVSYLRVAQRNVPVRRVFLGIALSAVVSACVSGAVFFGASTFTRLPRLEVIAFAAAAGIVCSETTRHSVRWVVERYGAAGPLSDLAADTARASALFAALSLSVVNAWLPGAALPAFSVLGRVGVSLGLGVVLGLTAALLLGREFRRDESWGILLGTCLLGTGAAARLNLSPLSATFAMGLTLAIVSPHRLDIKAMITPTEKPVLLPVVLLAGAYVNVRLPTALLVLVVVALVVKLIARVLCGTLLSVTSSAVRGAGSEFGLSMLSSGALGLAVALAFAVRHPGQVSDSVLLLAALGVLVGEWLGPGALRRALTRVGEIKTEPSPASAAPASAAPASLESRA
ncbi:MAG: potassium transporter Kef [Polyangiaceae bacterium]